jgi:mannosyltransferase OCH1-like enzyme
MKIPYIFFTYWEGVEFSRLHCMTIQSLYTLHPNVSIRVYMNAHPTESSNPWTTREHSTPITNVIPIETIKDMCTFVPIDFTACPNITAAVHRADYTRIVKMYEHGGMWFDFDILFIRPIPAHIFEVSFAYHTYENTFPTGIVFASPRNPHVHTVYTRLNETDFQTIEYQTIGPKLWETILPDLSQDPNVLLLETSSVYPYMYSNIDCFFFSRYDKIHSNTWAIHWYNGTIHAKRFINEFQNVSDPPRSVFDKYALKV